MKNNEPKKKIVYEEQEERVIIPGMEDSARKEIVFKLKDLVSCLNLCDYELDEIRKKVSASINQLDNG